MGNEAVTMNGRESADSSEKYRVFPLELLRLDEVVNFEIYLWHSAREEHVLFCGRNLTFTREARDRLLASGVSEIHVRDSEQHAFSHYVEENLTSLLDDPELPP